MTSKKPAERQVLKAVTAKARSYGLYPLRLSFRQGVEVGWPDMLVFGPNRHLLGIECKRPGQDPTPIQLERGQLMLTYGFAWCKVDRVQDVDFVLSNFARFSIGEPILTRDQYAATKRSFH